MKDKKVALHSVWRIGQRLVVVTALLDGWITIQYIDDNNGMRRTGDVLIDHFLEHYTLFYKPDGGS